ncbi:unnamed protein product [Absidia cylindrospora]
MVVMALVTTIMTTPFVIKLYPDWYQKQQAALALGSRDLSVTDSSDGKHDNKSSSHLDTTATSYPTGTSMAHGGSNNDRFTMVTVLNRMETMPAVMALMRLLKSDDDIDGSKMKPYPHVHAMRLLELTQRPSDVMKIQEMRETLRIDPVLSVIRTFASLIGIRLTTDLDFASPTDFIKRIGDYSSSVDANMVLLPWQPKQHLSSEQDINPFDRTAAAALAGGSSSYQVSDAEFATHAFTVDHCTVGLFLDRGFGNMRDANNNVRTPQQAPSFQILVPFIGGKDDRRALLFALRLQMYRHADVLVLRQKPASSIHNNNNNRTTTTKTDTNLGSEDIGNADLADSAGNQHQEQHGLLYATPESIATCLDSTYQHQLQHMDGDNDSDTDATLFGTLFQSNTKTPGLDVVCQWVDDISATSIMRQGTTTQRRRHDLIVLGRRYGAISNPFPSPSPLDTPGTVYSKEFSSALGTLAFDLLSSGVKASLVVIQAPSKSTASGHHSGHGSNVES